MFLASHILDWIYSEGFDKVTISETILNGVAMLENASESGSACKSGNYVMSRQSLTFFIILLLTAKILVVLCV